MVSLREEFLSFVVVVPALNADNGSTRRKEPKKVEQYLLIAYFSISDMIWISLFPHENDIKGPVLVQPVMEILNIL